ncbi:zinc ribbon domain-containing protein [Atlantibacter hermannii]|uniref:zinc ribbon domain-containing protein n=1 Tax=Atlantibacter hermannii TaxID=565 RepID=UPI0028A1EED8|nr:zinc ribbon domain-containing protein [Atlantibacter hermannii]
MEIQCPHCQQPVEVNATVARCEHCQQDITLKARCPDCHQPLQVLKACGAVDYFCQNGHGLISKKRVEFVPQ